MQFLLTLIQYFFEPLPSGQFKYLYFFIALAVLAFIASIALRIFLKKQKDDKIFRKIFRDLPGKLQLFAIMEGLYILVRLERMPYLSIRFLNYCILAYGAYTAVRYVQLYLTIYPAEKKHHAEQLKLNKYLPRKGGKKR
ncbi:MAG: hypothetical protein U0519_01780 [Candidatus Gracilibacteria bacterium]